MCRVLVYMFLCVFLCLFVFQKASTCQCRRLGFDPWVRKFRSLGEDMATHSSILTWESHGQRSLAGYSPRGCKRARHDRKNKLDSEECKRVKQLCYPFTRDFQLCYLITVLDDASDSIFQVTLRDEQASLL